MHFPQNFGRLERKVVVKRTFLTIPSPKCPAGRGLTVRSPAPAPLIRMTRC